jgi:hypothetical protein
MAATTLLKQALTYLEGTKNRWPELSRASGVPYSTITKIAQGVARDPRVSTIQRLLDHRDGAASSSVYPNTDSPTRKITEKGGDATDAPQDETSGHAGTDAPHGGLIN